MKDGPGSQILKFPIKTGELAELLNVSLPADEAAIEAMDLTPFNVFQVPMIKPPAFTKPLVRHIPDTPVWAGDQLVRTFKEVEYTPEEIERQWKIVRRERDRRLAVTDWTQSVTDISDEKREAFAAYRATLRDFPSQITDPFAVAWPEKPV